MNLCHTAIHEISVTFLSPNIITFDNRNKYVPPEEQWFTEVLWGREQLSVKFKNY